MAATRIEFYSTRGQYGVFSNFAKTRIASWPTAEHCFQSLKFCVIDMKRAEQIRGTKTASEAAKMGRSRQGGHRIDPRWEEVKIDLMHATLHLKFDLHPAGKQTLLGTGDAILVEKSPKDAFWGSGKDGKGQNHLGEELMALRTYYASGAPDVSHSSCLRCASPGVVGRFALFGSATCTAPVRVRKTSNKENECHVVRGGVRV